MITQFCYGAKLPNSKYLISQSPVKNNKKMYFFIITHFFIITQIFL